MRFLTLILLILILTAGEASDISPLIDITAPLNNYATNQEKLMVYYTFMANKDNPGQGASGSVSLIELLINGEVSQTYANPPQVKEGSGSFEVDLNIPDQILRLQTCAYQGDVHAGLKGCSEEVQVYIDKTMPEISLIEVPSSYTNNYQSTFRIGYTDNLSGIDTIKVRMNGNEITEGLSITAEELFYQPIIPLQDGSYMFEIEVKDKAGNVATNSVNFTIDTVPPEPPAISIDRMIDANPGIIIEEVEGRIIITLRGNQDRVTIIGEESENGNTILVYAPSPLIVGEVEYTSSFRVEISGIIEGKHIVKVFEQDQAGNESKALITVEIDSIIEEIIDFSPLKVKINRVRGIIYPVYSGAGFIIGDYNALPGSPEELTELKNRLKDLVSGGVFRIDSGESAFNYRGYWLSYHEGHIPNIEGITGEEIKEKYEEFIAKLEWVQTPQVTDTYYFQIGNISFQNGGSSAWGRSLEEAFNKAVSQWGLSEFIPITYSGGDYGTGISAISHSPESYSVGIYTQNFRGNFELPQNLIVYIPFSNTGGREYWGVPVKVEEYQVSAAGRFTPGWQYIEFIDNEKEIPEIPEGCYYPPYWCGYVYDFRHLHQMVMYARAIPPEVEIEKIEITPKPQDGENAVNICFLSEQQFTAYVHLHLVYTNGSISNTFKVRLPLTSTIGVIDADGSFVATESGEGEVIASYGGVTGSVKVNVIGVDIEPPLYNGKIVIDPQVIARATIIPNLQKKLHWETTIEGRNYEADSLAPFATQSVNILIDPFPTKNDSWEPSPPNTNTLKASVTLDGGIKCEDAINVQYFYSATANQSPGDDPNWYYYYSQTGASTGAHKYGTDSEIWGEADGHYDHGKDYFVINAGAHGQDFGLVEKGWYIDNFGSTCLHENAHMTYWLSHWGTAITSPVDQDGDRDGDGNIVGDGLKDSDERDDPDMVGLNGERYDPTKVDTNGDGTPDGEDYACTFEDDWVIGSYKNVDWSSPGSQYP